jgi:outer membrane receptor protein involved in Fe transport
MTGTTLRLVTTLAVAALLTVLSPGSPARAADPATLGGIEGSTTTGDGVQLGGVRVLLSETGAERVTDRTGRFAFTGLEPGSYTLTFSFGPNPASESVVVVEPDTTTEVRWVSEWELSFADTMTVVSASRRRERIVDAPAAVTTLAQDEIARRSTGGQLPRLLEFTPGAELTQGSLYEFNLNIRGMNDVFNRRVLTLVDGRDTSSPSLGHQEWAGIGFPLDDLADVELVRGPGSALYGADAFNGVLNLTTRAPRFSRGGNLRLTGGELSTRQVDLRYATSLGGDWYLKLLGGVTRSDDFTLSRNESVEYSRPCAGLGDTNCLPLESMELATDENEIDSGSVRIDKYFGERSLAIEGGTARFGGPVAATEFGRMQFVEIDRPWARANFNTQHWNALAYYTGRKGERQVFLNGGYWFYTDSDRFKVELQGNTGFAGGRGFMVGGISATREEVDSADPQGVQTVTYATQEESFEALFGQVEYDFSPKLRGVLAARFDRTTLHDDQLSPRASLVYSMTPSHTLRLSAGEAFLTPNYAQLFLYLPAFTPLDLSPFEAFCAPFGVSCGFDDPVMMRIVGNRDNQPEEVRSLELGYSAVLGQSTLLRFDLYSNRYEEFLSDYIPYVNPTFGGRLHDNYLPWAPPSALPAPAADLLLGALATALPPELFATLSTGVYGEPFFPILSLVNFGRVDTRGFELAVDRSLGRRARLDAGYAWFDFDIKEDLPEDPALPNSAEHKFNVGLTWLGERFDAALMLRYSDSFEWAAGVFKGHVPSYSVADLAANYYLGDSWRVGVDVSNLFDESHYQYFGGDLLARRVLGHVSWAWQ